MANTTVSRRKTVSRTSTKPKGGRREPPPAPDSSPDPDPNQWASITTLAPERPYATVDNQRHPYRLIQDFGAIEHRELERYSAEFKKLLAGDDEVTDDQEERYEELLDWLFDHVLVNPGRLREQLDGDDPETGEPRLTGGIKYAIVTTFTEAPARAMQSLLALTQLIEARDASSISGS